MVNTPRFTFSITGGVRGGGGRGGGKAGRLSDRYFKVQMHTHNGRYIQRGGGWGREQACDKLIQGT